MLRVIYRIFVFDREKRCISSEISSEFERKKTIYICIYWLCDWETEHMKEERLNTR